MSFLADLFTDSARRHADEMALCAVAGVATFLGLAIYSVVFKGQPFDPQAYGTGLGLAIGAAAAGMGLKAKLEPPQGS
jgi:hypothetical protein